ncbi:hypothetical protein LZ554_003556 [Drepanopeziza brunnea f. sp. 'monogermtubi']|nr:hypothetical protein LZ554_003556 [Drepanopeziza brunnea f. sp. 'monogermtubi']
MQFSILLSFFASLAVISAVALPNHDDPNKGQTIGYCRPKIVYPAYYCVINNIEYGCSSGTCEFGGQCQGARGTYNCPDPATAHPTPTPTPAPPIRK